MAVKHNLALTLLMVCLMFGAVVCQATNASENSEGDIADTLIAEARTFGHHFLKRMSFAVVPGAFVVGVITTLLAALTVVSMKGLGVGVILLVLAIGQMLSRAITPIHAAAAYAAPAAAPVPVVYSHSHTQQPVWLEKEW